jgi:hypothetical protein
MEGDPELTCPRVTDTKKTSPDASALTDRNTLHPLQVSFFKRKEELAFASPAPFEFPHFLPSSFL